MRLKSSLKKILVVVIFSTAIWAVANRYLAPAPEPFTPTQTSSEPGAKSFAMTIVQHSNTTRRILSCVSTSGCRPVTPIASSNTEAVTDGASWYHYENDTLKRTWPASGESSTIITKTPLAAPRDLIISPDNQKVAFWFDNINEPQERLTELWAYDALAGGTKVLAEKVSQAAVLAKPRWNKTSSHLWFLGDTSKPDEPAKIELLVVSLNPPGITAKFNQVAWQKFSTVAASGPLDINLDGTRLVFGQPKTLLTSSLLIADNNSPLKATTVRGRLVHFAWLEGDALLYATQDSHGFTFWRLQDSQHTQLFRSPGKFLSAYTGRNADSLAFSYTSSGGQVILSVYTAASGNVTQQYKIPVFGSTVHIISLTPEDGANPDDISVASELDDGQIANFIENNLAAITHQDTARPVSLIITEQINTIFLTYSAGGDSKAIERLQVTINDAARSAWTIRARYAERGGEWVKTEGANVNEPKPLRLYDWEAELNQWILKEEYTN